jgi:hypothetical protein
MAPYWLNCNTGETTLDHGAHSYECDFQVHMRRGQNRSDANAVTDVLRNV